MSTEDLDSGLRIIEQPEGNLEAMRIAASEGNLEAIKGLDANGAMWDNDAVAAAAGNGHLEVMKWFHGDDEWNENDYLEGMCPAAENGHLEVVQWLATNADLDRVVDHDCFDRETDFDRVMSHVAMAAAKNGHLEIVKWLENIPGLDERIVDDWD